VFIGILSFKTELVVVGGFPEFAAGGENGVDIGLVVIQA